MKTIHIILALCLVVAALPSASAVALSYAPIESPVLWEPGKDYSYKFSLSDYGYDATIELEGDWAKYVTFDDISSPKPGVKEFIITISPPRTPDTPGHHGIYIGGKEITPGGGGGVGAVAAVRKRIAFNVLYPFKDIDAWLVAPDVNIGDTVHFQVPVNSLSLPTINSVKAVITITDADGNLLGTIPTDSLSLARGEHKRLNTEFDTTGLKPATYHAEALVTFDGNTTTVEDTFRVGTLQVDITDFTTEAEVGIINPVFIEIKSGWNDPIKNVYGQLYVDGKSVLSTPTINLEAWEHVNLTGYFDATTYDIGTYESTILIHFGDGDTTIEKSSITILEQKKAGGGWIAGLGWMHLLIAGILFLVALLVVNIVLLTRRGRKDDKK